jgi:cell division protein FtsQ
MPRVAKQRQIVRPSRLKLALRRQRRLVRPISFTIVGFVAAMLALAALHSAQTGGRVARLQKSMARAIDLRVADIVIQGRANTPEPLLREALGVSKGDPILGFSVTGARDRIEGLSWIAHVAVERRLPGTIFVDITERRPFAIWQNQKQFTLIDREGQVVTNEDITSFGDLPLVVGRGAPAHAAALLDLLTTMPDLRGRLAAMIRVGDRRWDLQLKNKIIVKLPEGHEQVALQRLEDLQAKQSLLDRPLVFIDLRLGDRLAVRARPSALTTPDIPATETPHDSANRRAT